MDKKTRITVIAYAIAGVTFIISGVLSFLSENTVLGFSMFALAFAQIGMLISILLKNNNK